MESKFTRREFLRLSGGAALGLAIGGIMKADIFRSGNAQEVGPDSQSLAYPEFVVNGNFENGLNGWIHDTGDAFSSQPIRGDTITAAEVDPSMVPLGGDYWRNSPYHVGYEGLYLVRSNPNRGDGFLWSAPFMIPNNAEAIAFLLGGTTGMVRIEVLAANGKWVVSATKYQDITRLPSQKMILREERLGIDSSLWGSTARIAVIHRNIEGLVQGSTILVDNFRIITRGASG